MSSRRSVKDSSISSLDMFLDTICNTFGGILFILLFVIILLKVSGEKLEESLQDSVTEQEFEQIQQELNDIEAEWDQLKQEHDLIFQLNQKLTPGAAEAWNELKTLQETNQNLIDQMISDLSEITEINHQIVSITTEHDQVSKEFSELMSKIDQAKDSEEQIKSSRNRVQTLPKMHYSDKEEIGLIIRYGRLYVWHTYSGYMRSLNEDDFIVTDETLLCYHTEPKPWCGIDLKHIERDREQLEKIFTRFPAEYYKMTLVINPDSFAEFAVISEILKKRGYEIRPIPTRKGSGVYDRGGSNSSAQ